MRVTAVITVPDDYQGPHEFIVEEMDLFVGPAACAAFVLLDEDFLDTFDVLAVDLPDRDMQRIALEYVGTGNRS